MKNFKKYAFDGLKIVVLGALLSVGVSYASWLGPTQAPPGGNAFAPINTTSSGQTKGGSLGLGGLIVGGTSFFADKVAVGGQVPGSGISFPAADLQVSGTLTTGGHPSGGCTSTTCQTRMGYDGTRNYLDSDTELLFNYNTGKDVFFGSSANKSNVTVTGDLTVSNLSNSPGGDQVCADPNGLLVTCGPYGGNNPPPGSVVISAPGVYNFSSPGSINGISIPAGITQVYIQAWGAGGGGGDALIDDPFPGTPKFRSSTGSAGGGGAFASGAYTIQSGMVYKVKVGSGGDKGNFPAGQNPEGGIATLFGPSTTAGLPFNSSTFGFYPKPAWDPNGSGTTTNGSQTGWWYYIRAGGGNGGYNSDPVNYPTNINYGGTGGTAANSTSVGGPIITGTTHVELNGGKGDDGHIKPCISTNYPIGGLNGQVSASSGRGGNATHCGDPAAVTPSNGVNGQIVISW